MATKEENEGRIFPVSDSAKSVWDALIKYMKEVGVKVQTGVEVAGLSVTDTKNIIIKTRDKKEIIAKSCVLATGGTSRPETGSTGEDSIGLKNWDI